MGRFTEIPQTTFDELQLEAGVLMRDFDPENPELKNENIICATTGGINPTCTATYRDDGEDIDNCPNGMKELKHLTGWECGISFTALTIKPETIRLALGAADISVSDGKITPRKELKDTDFADIWWVGDRSDGGLVAICLKNALSTAGLALTTTKNGKGTVAVTLTGHFSVANQDEVPMEFYVQEGETA